MVIFSIFEHIDFIKNSIKKLNKCIDIKKRLYIILSVTSLNLYLRGMNKHLYTEFCNCLYNDC